MAQIINGPLTNVLNNTTQLLLINSLGQDPTTGVQIITTPIQDVLQYVILAMPIDSNGAALQ